MVYIIKKRYPLITERRISSGKIIFLSVIFLVASILSGCITIYERYNFNSNGSGTMEYLIDMSEFYQMMTSFSESLQNDEIHIDQSFIETAEDLKSVNGISNVKLTGNSKEYTFGISYNFAGPESLNEAMAVILHSEAEKKEYIRFRGRDITRYSVISDEFSKERIIGEDESEMDEGMLKEIFEQMKYKITMNFSRPVKSVTTRAEYTIDKNNITVETNFNALLENNKVLETVIRLK